MERELKVSIWKSSNKNYLKSIKSGYLNKVEFWDFCIFWMSLLLEIFEFFGDLTSNSLTMIKITLAFNSDGWESWLYYKILKFLEFQNYSIKQLNTNQVSHLNSNYKDINLTSIKQNILKPQIPKYPPSFYIKL